jgi:hypothetical protein
MSINNICLRRLIYYKTKIFNHSEERSFVCMKKQCYALCPCGCPGLKYTNSMIKLDDRELPKQVKPYDLASYVHVLCRKILNGYNAFFARRERVSGRLLACFNLTTVRRILTTTAMDIAPLEANPKSCFLYILLSSNYHDGCTNWWGWTRQ